MPTFSYQARNPDGQSVAGTIVAETTTAAARMLDERRLLPTQINEVDEKKKSIMGGNRKVSMSKVGVTYEQLGDLLRAGVPILRAIKVLSSQSSNAGLSHVLREVHEDVAGGDTLGDAMAKHPEAFPALHVSMIRAGEKGGFLEDVLGRLSEFVARADTLRNKLIGSLIYPCILMLGGIGAVLMILLYVVPKLRPMLVGRGIELNFLTKGVFAANTILTAYWMQTLGVVVALIIGLVLYFRSESGQALLSRLQLRAPLIGPLYTMVSLCRFCRIFGTLLANGIPIIQSLHIAKDSAGNLILAEAIGEAAENVSAGDSLAEPLGRKDLFPPAILDMIAVAEESNTLEMVLVEIANTQEERTARQIDLFVRMLEPMMLLAMGGMVLLIAIALMLPILKLSAGGLQN
ncbi:MAG: type II secretion system F family protein [Planctomycetaceae bacterium]